MRFALVGPVYPYRGGIAHHSRLLAQAIARDHSVSVHSFRRQYPRWLYPGTTDQDPGAPPEGLTARYDLDPLDPRTWQATAAAIAAERPDLAVLQWWIPFWAPALGTVTRLLRRRGIPVAYLCHNIMPHESRPWDQPLVRYALSAGCHLVVHAQGEADRASSLGLRVPVTRHAMPSFANVLPARPAPGDARAALGITESRVLLFFGLVRPYKGLDVLLRAWPLAFPEEGTRLVIAGEFWAPLERYQELARSLGIEGSLTWLPRYLPDEEVSQLMAAADAVVLPYLSATQSAVVQLAHGAGLPVITTTVGGLPEAVADGKTGLLVPPGDAPALAASLRRFYDKDLGPAMRKSIAAAASGDLWRSLVRLLEEIAQHAPAVRHTSGA